MASKKNQPSSASRRARWARRVTFGSAVAGILSFLPTTGSFLLPLLQGQSSGDTYVSYHYQGVEAASVPATTSSARHADRALNRAAPSPASPMSSDFHRQLSLATQYQQLSPGHAAQAARAYLDAYSSAPPAITRQIEPSRIAAATRSYRAGKFDVAVRQFEEAFEKAGLLDR